MRRGPAKPERDAALVAAYRRDPLVTMAQLADKFGLTRERVRQIIERNGGTDGHGRAGRLTLDEHIALCRLWSQGAPLYEINRELGISRENALRQLALNGFDYYDRFEAPCGTRAAYNRHRRRGEPPCEWCRRASTVYARGRTRSGVGAACPTCKGEFAVRSDGLMRGHRAPDGSRCPGGRP